MAFYRRTRSGAGDAETTEAGAFGAASREPRRNQTEMPAIATTAAIGTPLRTGAFCHGISLTKPANGGEYRLMSFDRRDFLKTAGAGITACLAGAPTGAKAEPPEKDKLLRIASSSYPIRSIF